MWAFIEWNACFLFDQCGTCSSLRLSSTFVYRTSFAQTLDLLLGEPVQPMEEIVDLDDLGKGDDVMVNPHDLSDGKPISDMSHARRSSSTHPLHRDLGLVHDWRSPVAGVSLAKTIASSLLGEGAVQGRLH